jgi:two-component system, NarL family, response regulator NreC
MTITIALVDDHQVVRRGLWAVLAAEKDFHIVGEASDGLQAVELVERLKPDVLILDLILPGLNGLDVARQVRQRAPQTRIIILSMHADEAYVLEALKNGAMGYVLKESNMDELLVAVRQVVEGKRYLSPPISERAIEAYVQSARQSSADPYDQLTDREREVLQLLAEGFNHVEIGARLSISPRTVETHHTNLMRKLGLHARVDLIRYALNRGLLPGK